MIIREDQMRVCANKRAAAKEGAAIKENCPSGLRVRLPELPGEVRSSFESPCSPHTVRIADRSSLEVSAPGTPSRRPCTGYFCLIAAPYAATIFSCFDGKSLSEEPLKLDCTA